MRADEACKCDTDRAIWNHSKNGISKFNNLSGTFLTSLACLRFFFSSPLPHASIVWCLRDFTSFVCEFRSDWKANVKTCREWSRWQARCEDSSMIYRRLMTRAASKWMRNESFEIYVQSRFTDLMTFACRSRNSEQPQKLLLIAFANYANFLVSLWHDPWSLKCDVVLDKLMNGSHGSAFKLHI